MHLWCVVVVLSCTLCYSFVCSVSTYERRTVGGRREFVGHQLLEHCQGQHDGDLEGHLLSGLHRQVVPQHRHHCDQSRGHEQTVLVELGLPPQGQVERDVRVGFWAAVVLQHVPLRANGNIRPLLVLNSRRQVPCRTLVLYERLFFSLKVNWHFPILNNIPMHNTQ